ncbi:armadillo-type protein [Cantharellus anzutake]|uniref:armadillo-type protein n=1 Tax=Cantharellus anzutake TaxID=1750568 RepID=UPI0019054765|nr:armadillo-type protein [Cantharellus anzutake]KAF8334308.1 armadillo-type protein [Cantharellus anzutake]
MLLQQWPRVMPLSTPASPSRTSAPLPPTGMSGSPFTSSGWRPIVSTSGDGKSSSEKQVPNDLQVNTNLVRPFRNLSLERPTSKGNPHLNFQHIGHEQAAAKGMTLSRRDDSTGRRVVSDSDARGGLDNTRIDDKLLSLSPAPAVFPSINGPYTPPSSHTNIHSRDSPVPQAIGLPVGGPTNTVDLSHAILAAPLVNMMPRVGFPPPAQVEMPQAHFLGPTIAPPLLPEAYGVSQNVAPQHSLGPSNHLMFNSSGHPSLVNRYGPPQEPSPSRVPLFYPDFNSATSPPFFYPPPPNVLFQTPTVPVPNLLGTAIERQGSVNRKQSFVQNISNNAYHNIVLPSPTPFSSYLPHQGRDSSVQPPMPTTNGQSQTVLQSHRHGVVDSRHRRAFSANAQLGSARGPSSQLLEDFRATRFRPWSLKDVKGHIVEFSMDQQGSRFIQTALDASSAEERRVVFDEIHPKHTLNLITDIYGNYVVQKFIERGTPTQKNLVVGAMETKIAKLSTQTYGCRVVQKAIECVATEQQDQFIRELNGFIIPITKDSHGNHVIQKLIERVDPERFPFLETFRLHAFELASHPYGCRVLQRCFEFLSCISRAPLSEQLVRHAPELATDQFGNYVIQFVLETGDPGERAAIISRMKGRTIELSKHKFASNVVETALRKASSSDRQDIIAEIMTATPDGDSPITAMVRDAYANYVLQTALKTAGDRQKKFLVEAVRFSLVATRRFTNQYSKNLTAIENLISNDPLPSTPQASASKAKAKAKGKAVRFSDHNTFRRH